MSRIMTRLRSWWLELWWHLRYPTAALSERSVEGLSPEVTVAVGLCIVGPGCFLAQRRPGPAYAGCWELPGGKVEPGEEPRGAVVREWGEELGLRVGAGRLLSEVMVPTDFGLVRVCLFRVYRITGTPDPRSQEGGVLRVMTPEDMDRESVVPSWPYLRGAVVRALAEEF